MLENLHIPKPFKRMRASSYDSSGGNADSEVIPAGGSHTRSLRGPGIVRHIWMTLAAKTPDVYREIELVLHFDGDAAPQVRAPVADFFLFGHGLLVDVNSAMIQVSRQPLFGRPYRGSLNCVFPMPFTESATVSFRNTGTEDVNAYYYVDWESHEALEEDVLHFHASWNQEQTAPPAGQPRQPHGTFDSSITNVDSGENYTVLDVADHAGHYVGTGLSVACPADGAGKWWEGDDMFEIDGEPWPPRLHGTGTEDYFNLAWGVRRVDCRPEYGVTFVDKRETDGDQIDGLYSMYRFHLNDPIPFTRSLRVSIEHGHANDSEACYRSVAYWYGRRRRQERITK